MKLLFSPGYSVYLEVSPGLLETLLECTLYEKKYDCGYKYKKAENVIPELNLISESEFIVEKVQTIDINAIMEENNRLARELDKLKEKLKPVSASTELEIIE